MCAATWQRERNLSRPLRRKVRKYYQFYLDRKTAFDEASILGELTESLKAEAIMHLNRDIIGKIPFLKPVRHARSARRGSSVRRHV